MPAARRPGDNRRRSFLFGRRYAVDRPSQPIPTETHFVWELSDATARNAIFTKIQNPAVIPNTDEAGLFSAGIRVLEQHSQLLRALEARVADYSNFASLCTTALGNIQSDVGQAQTSLAQTENQLNQTRQNLAFTNSLLNDERQRVQGVNAQRTQILNTSVQVVVYTRPRTLDTEDDVPSRQTRARQRRQPRAHLLAAGNRGSARAARDRRALEGGAGHLAAGGRRAGVGFGTSEPAAKRRARHASARDRATAFAAAGVVGAADTHDLRAGHRERLSGEPTGRARLPDATRRVRAQPDREPELDAQVTAVAGLTTIADLGSSDAVHAEIANAVSLAQQQISSVAACVYSRANLALPVDRLAWAEFLRGPGLSIQLQSLAVLPNWNTQSYTDRQQMQQLVDWLFAQIDTTIDAAVAFMSDVVRVCILLASNAPADGVIAGAVSLRTQPSVGSIVSLNLPSTRIGSGMYIHCFRRAISPPRRW